MGSLQLTEVNKNDNLLALQKLITFKIMQSFIKNLSIYPQSVNNSICCTVNSTVMLFFPTLQISPEKLWAVNKITVWCRGVKVKMSNLSEAYS